jgi:hypothetical protein
MRRTKKTGTKQGKTKKNNFKKEEDLEGLYSDSDSDSDSDSETGSGSETDEEFSLSDFSLSKELDKAFIGSFDDIKNGDMTLPVFGIGMTLIAIIGFTMYKGSSV